MECKRARRKARERRPRDALERTRRSAIIQVTRLRGVAHRGPRSERGLDLAARGDACVAGHAAGAPGSGFARLDEDAPLSSGVKQVGEMRTPRFFLEPLLTFRK